MQGGKRGGRNRKGRGWRRWGGGGVAAGGRGGQWVKEVRWGSGWVAAPGGAGWQGWWVATALGRGEENMCVCVDKINFFQKIKFGFL